MYIFPAYILPGQALGELRLFDFAHAASCVEIVIGVG